MLGEHDAGFDRPTTSRRPTRSRAVLATLNEEHRRVVELWLQGYGAGGHRRVRGQLPPDRLAVPPHAERATRTPARKGRQRERREAAAGVHPRGPRARDGRSARLSAARRGRRPCRAGGADRRLPGARAAPRLRPRGVRGLAGARPGRGRRARARRRRAEAGTALLPRLRHRAGCDGRTWWRGWRELGAGEERTAKVGRYYHGMERGRCGGGRGRPRRGGAARVEAFDADELAPGGADRGERAG